MKAVRVLRYGGPEVLELEESPTPAPGPGQVLVRVVAAGVNFTDLLYRAGRRQFVQGTLPLRLGVEGAGVIEALGPEAADLEPGDAVCWVRVPGAYATHAIVDADRLVPLPSGLSCEEAATVVFQGVTAHYLSSTTYPLGSGDVCLIHAAAGGVGRLLCQMAKMRGARVIAAVSSESKCQIAREAGADEALLWNRRDFVDTVRRLAGGGGVSVVYDSIGRDTFETSLDCLAPRGTLVSYGVASGPIPPFDPVQLGEKGSLGLRLPRLLDHVATREDYVRRVSDVLEWARAGRLRTRLERTYKLEEAAEAHRAMEAGGAVGKLLLLP